MSFLCCFKYETGVKETRLIPRCFMPYGFCTCTFAHPVKKKRKSYHAKSEFRWSGVVGSGLRGGEVTKAAALAQFLLQ